jgi:two-component sensor histidine kinase
MNVYAILSFISFLLFLQALIIGFFVLKPSRIKNSFVAFTISFIFFSFFNFLQHTTTDVELVYKLDRLAAFGWLSFPLVSVFLIFRLSGSKMMFVRQVTWFVLLPLAVAPFIRFQIDPYSLKHFFIVDDVRFYSLNSGSIWFYIFVVYLLLSMGLGLYILFNWRKEVQQNRQKLQINVVLAGLVAFFIVSVITNLVLPYLGYVKIGPLAHVNAIPLGAALFYAVVNLRPQFFSRDIVSKLIANHLREFVFYFDQQLQVYSVNRYCLENLKYNSFEIMRLSPEKIFHDFSAIREMAKKVRKNQPVQEISTVLYSRSGIPIPVILTCVRTDDYLGSYLGMVLLAVDLRQKVKLQEEVAERTRNEKALAGIRQDLEILVEKRTHELFEANEKLRKEIIERKRAEQQISTDFKEKVQLVQEIHHRVKNNIQIIISLTNMLASHKDLDQASGQKLRRIAERIRKISAIHEDFYASKNLSRINFSEFIKSTTGEVYANKGTGNMIIFRLNVGNEFLEIDQAIPCGIIYTELLTNALQHAFPEGIERNGKRIGVGTINVEFYKRQDEFTLVVSDNGVGLPEGRHNDNNGASGMGLVNVLVKDHLKGSLTSKTSYGTSFILKFSK